MPTVEIEIVKEVQRNGQLIPINIDLCLVDSVPVVASETDFDGIDICSEAVVNRGS